MIKIYFNDGSKKKVHADTFVRWLNKCNLYIEDNHIFYEGADIGYYVDLLDNNFGVLDCILCLVLLAMVILAIMKGGVILWYNIVT